ncbi:unnamed protein product [Blepharisma stoltei]|uniref:F-BAR domain-containing protein n=1 Tax=Blepharisma stoltei TaxID=1481888 RepID=A0AAU9I4E6_9CILI|nr:unnamed protein product [Blepharisma stoltei]
MHPKSLQESFQVFHHTSHMRRKEDREFVLFLTEIASLEELYARGLEKIGNYPYEFKEEGGISEAIAELKAEQLYKAKQVRTYAEKIITELADPFKDLLKNQSQAIKKAYAKMMNIDKSQELILEKYKSARNKYWKSCSECEQYAISLEESKSKIKTEKIVQKLLASKKEIDISLKGYLETVEEFDKHSKKYKTMVSNVIETYEKQEEKRLNSIKDSLIKITEYEAESLVNSLYEIQALKSKMHSIEISQEIDKFKSESPDSSLFTLEIAFEPYEGVHPSFRSLMGSPIISIPTSEDQKWDKLSTQSAIEGMYLSGLETIIEKAWNGIELNVEDYINFNHLIKDPQGRKSWSRCMNLRRSHGIFTLNELGFRQVGELMISVLNECELVNDIQIGKSVIILSQTFHKILGDGEDKKQFLQNFITHHSLWAHMEFWDQVIQTSINEENKNHENLGMTNAETSQETSQRLKRVVFCQLISYSHIMITFQVNQLAAAELVLGYVNKYKIILEEANQLMAMIDKDLLTKIKDLEGDQYPRLVEWAKEYSSSVVESENSDASEDSLME